MTRLLGVIWLLTLIAMAVIVSVFNTEPVVFHLPTGAFTLPLGLLISVAFAAGMIMIALLMAPQLWKMQWHGRQLERKLNRCESDNLKLRQSLLEAQHQQHIQSDAPALTEKKADAHE